MFVKNTTLYEGNKKIKVAIIAIEILKKMSSNSVGDIV